MASEGKSLRRIIEDAIQQIETFKNPDVTEAEGVLSDLIKAAGLGDIRGETLAYVSIRDGNVAVRTEYYSRGGSCGEHYDFPEAIIDAADPIATAKEWGLRRKVANLERERDEARSALAHYEERLATAQSALDAFLSPALTRPQPPQGDDMTKDIIDRLERRMPATQDMDSTNMCEDMEDAIALIASQAAMIAEFCTGSSLLIPFGNINPCHHDVRTEFDKSLTLGVRGFKFYPADHGYDPFSTEMKHVYCECAERGLPVMFHTGFSAQRDASQRHIHPRDFEPICRDLPGLILILAHAGRPHWYEDACQLALEYPNLYLDTGLLRAEEIERCLSFTPSVRHKLLFGSDWPICGSYSTHIAELSGGGISPDSEPELFFSNGRALLDRMRIA